MSPRNVDRQRRKEARWKFAGALLIAIVGVALGWQWRQAQVEHAVSSERAQLAVNVAATPPRAEYFRDVKTILDRRCLVCHACYDAPCQLKLDSPDGIFRGATVAKVYESTRLAEIEPTRLFVDAHTTEQWRERGFFSVLNGGEQNAPIGLDNSVLYQMLTLKRAYPLPERSRLPADLDTSLDRAEFCPKSENFSQYADERRYQGMPFGLPALSDEEFDTIKRWLENGAPVEPAPPLNPETLRRVADWERFFNRDDLKAQLTARYLYEHLFLADLYLDSRARNYFKLVRSRTPPGVAIDLIATRRPYDDPGVQRVFYRLQPVQSTIVAKTHLPYRLDELRMQRFDQLFLRADYSVSELPSYETNVSANPFVAFAQIPVQSRYQFLLDDSKFFLMTFIKGPVCRGQIALNVIQDQFWIVFANPNIEAMVDSEFLARESHHLSLPAEMGDQPFGAAHWRKYSEQQSQYLEAKEKFLHEKFGNPKAVTLDLIWNGDAENSNAALTVFRHFDSASVVRGFVGAAPKTAWVIDYPMLERIYYLLVAGFDVYGDASHMLMTRLYMDFLRMEGEANFLHFLPKEKREAERKSWYQGVGANVRDSIYRKTALYQHESGIQFRSKNPKPEFFELLREHLEPSLSQQYKLENAQLPETLLKPMRKLAQLKGAAISYLPETVLLRVVIRGESDRVFTLIRNSDRSNVTLLFWEDALRRRQFDTLTVVPGIVGAYPNAFWVVNESDLPRLVQQLSKVQGPKGLRAVASRYAITRTDENFWMQSDWMLNEYRNSDPIGWGILDYSRYER